MTFAECIPILLNFNRTRRPHFPINDFLVLDVDEDMTLIYCEFTPGKRLFKDDPYQLTKDDLTATDWEVCK
jgi:hypothetical protein